jgi:hypothetical protein
MRTLLGLLLAAAGVGLYVWNPPFALPDVNIGPMTLPLRYVIAFVVLIAGLALAGSSRAGSRVVSCASCGWRGTLDRFNQGGGCPVCGSDTYRY